jgi:hypothetical protein
MKKLLKQLAKKSLGKLGLRRPAIKPPGRMIGSFTPLALSDSIGAKENFFIHDGYQPRLANDFFDDTSNDDQWQLEVYQFAREIADRDGLSTVCDIGCGSGYKLMRYFKDFDTLGLELPQTYNYLVKKYPTRKWQVADFSAAPNFQPDLVIASDIIEHLPNPDELLRYIKLLKPKQIVLSTPARNLLLSASHDGPPTNPAHVREWSFAEFRKYIGEYFDIEEHFISNPAQATQCILCKTTR